MNPADEAEIRPTDRKLAGAEASSFDSLKEKLRTAFKEIETTGHQSKPVKDLHGLDQQVRGALGSLQRPHRKPVKNDEPVPMKRGDLRSGFTSYLDQEASERNEIYDRPLRIDAETKKALESQTKRRASRALVRYLVAICVGVAGTLAWQSYGEAAKQIIATSAPELGWSPGAKQMIAAWVQQLGWTKSPAGSEKQVAPVAQIAVTREAPAAPSLDPEQAQQMARDLATLRQTVEQLAAGQDQVTREIGKLEAAEVEILAKITAAPPPPRPIVAPARKPMPLPPTSQAPVTPPTSLAPIPPRQ